MNAQHIADMWTLDRSEAAHGFAQVLVRMRADDLDAMLVPGQRLEPGASAAGRDGAYAACVAWMLSHRPVDATAPTVVFHTDGQTRQPAARFADGRHRFAVVRDRGARWVNVGCSRRWARHLWELGFLVPYEIGGEQCIAA